MHGAHCPDTCPPFPFVNHRRHRRLQAVPLALAENSGLPPIESLTAVKKRQLEEKNPYLGIDCNDTGEPAGPLGSLRELLVAAKG
jgi:hypothetical protein